MNIIEAAYTNTGCPWPGGAVAYCSIDDVLAIGRLGVYGDNVERCMIQTPGNGIYFVKISAQGDVERKWLSKQFRQIPPAHTTRDRPVRQIWIMLKEHPKAELRPTDLA